MDCAKSQYLKQSFIHENNWGKYLQFKQLNFLLYNETVVYIVIIQVVNIKTMRNIAGTDWQDFVL